SRLSAAEVVVALIANRLAAPSPLYDVAGWASGAAMAEIFAIPPMLLNDDRLGRVLEDFAPVAEAVRGAVMLQAVEAFGVDASRAGLRVVVPLRADSGFAKRWLDEVGPQAMRPLRYVSRREARLPATERTRYRGTLRPWTATDPAGGSRHWRVAYIWSSEEQRSVAEARARALAKAEAALATVARGLGGRHYKTKEQVDAKVAQILVPAVRGL